MIDQVEQKETVLSEQQQASRECTSKCLAEVFPTRAEKSGDAHPAGKTDEAREIKAEAKQIASIVKSSGDVREAAEDPKVQKLLSAARDSNQLDKLVKATNSILENPNGKVGYRFENNEYFGVLLRKEDRADSTITSDDPRFAGPLSEKQLDAAAARIADVVGKTGTMGEESVKHEINQTFGRALKNHQEDKLLEKINGDNLGDADINGTHQYIIKQALGVNWHGNHMTKFTLINDDVALVPSMLDKPSK
jgi:hypothetical protein